jgi:hypothetical protein
MTSVRDGAGRPAWPFLRLREAAVRRAVYAALGPLLFVLAVAAVLGKKEFDFVVSDGRGYYVYLSSLVVDGDLDFANQMREHWGSDPIPPLEDHRTPRGLVRNKYPIGLALTLAPPFLTAHAAALACHALTGADWCAPHGYSVPYQLANLLFLLALAVWSMVLTDRLLTEAFGTNPLLAAFAVVLYWLGSPLLYYTFREPFMAHGAGAFWVTATVYLVWRLREGLRARRLPAGRLALVAFTTSMALVCRPTNAVVLPFHLYLLACVARAGLLGALLRRLPLALPGLLPLAAQALVWHELYGRWLMYSYEGEGFHWARPAAWQTLFSSRHGLFFWSPLLLLAAGGVAWRLRRPQPLLVCYLAAFLLLWYANSCWDCWWFGDAFGARAFLELSGLFVLGLAGACEAARRAGRAARRAFVAALGVALAYHFVLMLLYILKVVPRGDALL